LYKYNRLLKKIAINFLTTVFTFSIIANRASAQNINYKIPNPSKFESLEDVINSVASLIRPLFLITFGAMILMGAYQLLTSQGDDGKVENSKKTMTAAVVGFVIAVLAPTVVNFTLNLLGVDPIDF